MSTLDLRNLSDAVRDEPVQHVEKPELVTRTVTFSVSYTVPQTGKVLSDSFTGTIIGREGRAKEGRIKALLAGRFRFDDMPEDWRWWATAVAYCEVRLTAKPAWFADHSDEDERLLQAVYGRLLEHEQAFFRADVSESDGAEERPVVVVR
jgi:hypothetical protein